jgi:hypothetical protein
MFGIRLKRRRPECAGHHWHVTRRGWVCCHCPTRVSANDRPAAAGACIRTGQVDDLDGWLARLAPTRRQPAPGPRRARVTV